MLLYISEPNSEKSNRWHIFFSCYVRTIPLSSLFYISEKFLERNMLDHSTLMWSIDFKPASGNSIFESCRLLENICSIAYNVQWVLCARWQSSNKLLGAKYICPFSFLFHRLIYPIILQWYSLYFDCINAINNRWPVFNMLLRDFLYEIYKILSWFFLLF